MKEKVKRTDPVFACSLDFAGRLWLRAARLSKHREQKVFMAGRQGPLIDPYVTGWVFQPYLYGSLKAFSALAYRHIGFEGRGPTPFPSLLRVGFEVNRRQNGYSRI